MNVGVSETNFLCPHDDFNLNQCVILVELIVEDLLDTLVNNLTYKSRYCNQFQCYVFTSSVSLEGIYMCICRYVIVSHSLNIITSLCCPIFTGSLSSKLRKFIDSNFLSFYTIDDSYCFLDHDCVVKCVDDHVDRNVLPPCSGNGGSTFLSTWMLITGLHVVNIQYITVRLLTVLTFLCYHNIFVAV